MRYLSKFIGVDINKVCCNIFQKRDGPVDISSYLHPSMTENPWAELERINESNVGSSLQNETNESFSKLENDSESDFNICTDNEENPDTTTEISRD